MKQYRESCRAVQKILRSSAENSRSVVKGSVSRDFFTLVFFIKQILFFPLDMPRKDFKFFRIFCKLFVFVINSLVFSLPGSRDSPVKSPLGSHDFHVYSSLGSRLKFVLLLKLASTKYTRESKLPRD